MVTSSCYVVEYDERFVFAVPPEQVWAAIEELDQFQRWWGWLAELIVDGDGLRTGSVLRGTVAPPLPYRMRLRVELDRCVPPRLIDASVHGDLEGEAHLRLDPEPPGTAAEVAWTIEMMQRPMRLAARVAPPVLRWGHDRVVDATVSSFRTHLRHGAGVTGRPLPG
jgi:uncharacterized protein YndB with AHSA1/START domain